MGICPSKHTDKYGCEEDASAMIFMQKMKLLQQEISAILKQREEESEAYEREMMVFAFKEAEWKRERKELKREVKRLRKGLREREETRIEGGKSSEKGGGLSLVEQMREERARRDETVEKWKMLYLAIKNELDDLIQKTHQGTLCWKAEEEYLIEELQRELKAKDETIEILNAQIVSMEHDEYKRKREVDILRQSLKIMSSKTKEPASAHVSKACQS